MTHLLCIIFLLGLWHLDHTKEFMMENFWIILSWNADEGRIFNWTDSLLIWHILSLSYHHNILALFSRKHPNLFVNNFHIIIHHFDILLPFSSYFHALLMNDLYCSQSQSQYDHLTRKINPSHFQHLSHLHQRLNRAYLLWLNRKLHRQFINCKHQWVYECFQKLIK